MRFITKALTMLASIAVLIGIGISPAQAATDYTITETNGTPHARGWRWMKRSVAFCARKKRVAKP